MPTLGAAGAARLRGAWGVGSGSVPLCGAPVWALHGRPARKSFSVGGRLRVAAGTGLGAVLALGSGAGGLRLSWGYPRTASRARALGQADF